MCQREYRKGTACFHFSSSFKLFSSLEVNGKIQILVFYFCPMCRTKDIPELFVIGRPDMTIVAFGSDVLDIFEVNDMLSSKGWHLNALQRPNRWTLSVSLINLLRVFRK